MKVYSVIKVYNAVTKNTIQSGDLLQNIIVPTLDTARTHYLIDVCVNHDRPVLFCGPTGTGKSAYIKQKLMSGLSDEKFVTTFINFSAKTTANQTQNLIMSRLDKRRKGFCSKITVLESGLSS